MATTLTNIDPAFVCAGNENSFASNFYARLVKLDEDQQPDGTLVANTDPARVKGDLATSWTVSPDGKAYTFSLHPGPSSPTATLWMPRPSGTRSCGTSPSVAADPSACKSA
ncbi:conserved hypothetical protein [Arthrobacter sp. Hiyo8]|nr:conserved hypothetical protein [Arthrobacter sp. Hiyo8]